MAAVLRHDSQDVVDGEWAQGLVGVGGPGLEHKGLPKPAGIGETQVDLEQVLSGIFHRVQRVGQAGGLLSSTVQGDRGD